MKRAVGRIMSHVMPIKLASAPLSLAHWIGGTQGVERKAHRQAQPDRRGRGSSPRGCDPLPGL